MIKIEFMHHSYSLRVGDEKNYQLQSSVWATLHLQSLLSIIFEDILTPLITGLLEPFLLGCALGGPSKTRAAMNTSSRTLTCMARRSSWLRYLITTLLYRCLGDLRDGSLILKIYDYRRKSRGTTCLEDDYQIVADSRSRDHIHTQTSSERCSAWVIDLATWFRLVVHVPFQSIHCSPVQKAYCHRLQTFFSRSGSPIKIIKPISSLNFNWNLPGRLLEGWLPLGSALLNGARTWSNICLSRRIISNALPLPGSC